MTGKWNKAAGTRFCFKFRVSCGIYCHWNFGSGVGRMNLPSEFYWTWWLKSGADFLSFGPEKISWIVARLWCEDCLPQCCGYWNIHCSCWVWKNVVDTSTDILCACSEKVSLLLAQTSETVFWLRVQTWYVLVLIYCRGYLYRHCMCWFRYIVVVTWTYIVCAGSDILLWLLVQTLYVLVQIYCRGYLYRHCMCWFRYIVVITCTDIVCAGSDILSWLLEQTLYVLVLIYCRGYLNRHCMCWFWYIAVVTWTDIVCAGSDILPWLLEQTLYVLVLIYCRDYLYRHLCAGSDILSWLLVQTLYVLFMKECFV